MRTFLTSILAGLAPRRAGRIQPAPGLFRRSAALGAIRDLAVSADGGVWLAGDGGLRDLLRERLHPVPGDGRLTHVAGWTFLAAGGPEGLYVLAGHGLDPVEPREAVEALTSAPEGIFAATRDLRGVRHLRFAAGPDEPWHERYRPEGPVRALAPDSAGGVLLAGEEGLLRLDSWGRATPLPLPEGAGHPERLVRLGDRLLLGDAGGNCWLGDPSGGTWKDLGPGLPGQGEQGLALGGPGRVQGIGADGELGEDRREVPPPFREELLRPAGLDPRGGALALTGRAVLRSTRKRWKPLHVTGLSPLSLGAVCRTRAGALWACDEQGAVFHRTPRGEWTALLLPGDLRATGARPGADGEALLLPAHDPDREYRPGESLFWVAAPRREEVGGLCTREPDVVSLGPRTGEPVRAVCALGSDVFAAVGARLVRSRGGKTEVWGEEEGLTGTPILALDTLFDDLWVVTEGSRGPLRFAQGTADPDPVPDDGPAGNATHLSADEDSGQLWVGFEDGAKGGVASLSREGSWISQLRLPAPVRGVTASAGTMAAATGRGLFLLEEGSRQRKALGSADGLPEGGCTAVALSNRELLVGTARGLYRSDLEAWEQPEQEEMQV